MLILESFLQETIRKTKPDAVVVDYLFTDYFSINDIFSIKQHFPKLPILVISNDQQKSRVLTVLETGIHGYVTGECCEDEISRAVVAVAKGEKILLQ